MKYIKPLFQAANKFKWLIFILINLQTKFLCVDVEIQVESKMIVIPSYRNQGIQTEILKLEFHDNYIQEDLKVYTESEQGITLPNQTKEGLNIVVYFPKDGDQSLKNYFMNIPQNVLGRVISASFLPQNNYLLSKMVVRQVIKTDFFRQDEWKIQLQVQNSTEIEGVVSYTGRNQTYKMDCAECNSYYQISFELNYPNGIGLPSDCGYRLEEKELTALIENKQIDYTVIQKLISRGPNSTQVNLDVKVENQDIPNGFSQMKFIFQNYHFNTFKFSILRPGVLWREDFQSITHFGVFLAQNSLIAASLRPYFSSSNNATDFKYMSPSFLEISFYQQQYFTCQIKSIALPQAFSAQILKEGGESISVVFRDGDKVVSQENTIARNSGVINFPGGNENYLISSSSGVQTKLQLSRFDVGVVDEDELKIELNCKDYGVVSRKIPLKSNKGQLFQIQAILMQFDNTENKTYRIKFSISQMDLKGTYLVIEVPKQVMISDLNESSLIISGFTYKVLERSGNVFLFKQANITMNSIEVTLKQQVQLKDISNQKWKTSITCYNSDEFLFYSNDDTIQDIDIVSANGNKSQSTQLNLTSIELRNLKPYSDIQEIRSSVPSSLIIDFSLLNINPACAWVILVIPPEINIGRAQKSNFTLSDCSGQTHIFNEGSPIDKDSTIGYSQESKSIFISCTYMKSIAVKDSQNSMICLNNKIFIQNVENPESPFLTNVFKVFISNEKVAHQNYQDPPLNFKPDDIPNQIPSEYAYYPIVENRESKGIEIKEVFEARKISLISSSDYKNDVTTHILSMSFPIYLIEGIHALEIILPLKQLGLNPQLDIVCDNTSLFEARLPFESLEQVHLIIKIKDLIKPEQQITCRINNSIPIVDANLKSEVKILIYSQGNIIAQFSKLINLQGSNPVNNEWIKFNDVPIQISDTFVGKRDTEYYFNLSQLNIVDQQKQQQQYQISTSARCIRILMDSSLFIENTVKCFTSSICKNPSSNGADQGQNGNVKKQIACQKITSHVIEIDTLLLEQNLCQISVSGLQNPNLNIDSSNTQIKNLEFQFDYIWKGIIPSSQLPSKNKIVVINQIQLKYEVSFSCQSSCSGCNERYLNCRNCSQEYPLLSGEGNQRTCVNNCANYSVRVGSECQRCQVSDSNCAACSSSDIHTCTACQSGFLYEPNWKICIDESFVKMNRFLISSANSSPILTSHLKDIFLKADSMNLQSKSQIIEREQKRYLESKPNQVPSEEKENNSPSDNPTPQKTTPAETTKENNSGSMSSRLKDSLSDISSGNVFLVYAEIAAIAITILAALISSAIKKKQIKEEYCSEQKERDELSQVHRFNKRAFMLSLLTVAELFELPFSLLWAFSVSKGSWEHPVLQGIIGVTSLSVLQWMMDCYQQSCILINSDSTPPTRSFANPFSLDQRENPLSDLIIKLVRFIFFCLNPKGLCIIMTNLTKIEGWFILPMSDGAGKNAILLTNLRKILGSQIRTNAAGISSLIIFLSLKYSELMDNYAFVYDLMLFKVIMMMLCYFNVKLIDTLLEYLEETPNIS
uniref:MTAp n=1 Tax=Tetrahymena shanghaiensis TaxID=175566 RepID=A0A513X5B4_9HYMN|nr:MTAp [Tetrahymena shanghaiensis]